MMSFGSYEIHSKATGFLSTGGILCHKITHDKLSYDNSPGIADSFWLDGGNHATLLELKIISTEVVAVAMTDISGY